MKKRLLLLMILSYTISLISLEAGTLNKFKVKSNVSQKNVTSYKRSEKVGSITTPKSVSTSSDKQKKVTSSEILMSWDFEEVAEDNDWYIYDLDEFTTKWFEKALGWTLYDESTTNTVLLSQSWFTESNSTHADDWVFSESFTIPNDDAAYEVSWDAKAHEANPYNDGYECRIIEEATFQTLNEGFNENTELTVILAAFTSSSTVLYSTTGENNEWETRRATLNAYKGKTVRVAWRNNSLDKNVLYLDNVVAFKKDDYATTSKITITPTIPYTLVPQFLAKDYSGTISAKIDNNGSTALTGVTANFSAYKNDALDFSDLKTIGNLAVGASSTVVSNAYTVVAAKPANSYYFSSEVNATESAMSYAESITMTGPELSDSIYARDNGDMEDYTSIDSSSASATKKIGNYFQLIADTKLHSVTFDIYNCSATTTKVRVFSTTDFATLTEVAVSAPITLEDSLESETLYTANFDNLTLPAGEYVVTLDEPASKSIGLVMTSNSVGTASLYTTATAWKASTSTLYIRLKVSQPVTGINDIYSKVSAYYANGKLIVNGVMAQTNASLFNMAGQEILSTSLINENNTINTKLSKGIYILKVGTSTHKLTVQ